MLQLQAALGPVRAKLASVALQLLASKTEVMLAHPNTQSRRMDRCLGLTLDHRVNFHQATKEL